jgi:outer membrane protein assembly factor BamB/adenine/guanine phosphoribosyltransferase-like PRPP-binding protein
MDELKRAIESVALVWESPEVTIRQNEEGFRSKWLFDFRALLLQPKWLDRYADTFLDMFASRYPYQVCGMESASISLVSAIVVKSIERGTPVNGLFVRKSRKRQGLMKQVEGVPTDDPVILVDDLINSGATLKKQVLLLEEIDKRVTDVFVLLRFREPDAYDFFTERGIRLRTSFTLADFGLPMEKAWSPSIDGCLEEVWHFAAPNPSHHLTVQKSAPILDQTSVYFGTDDGTFFCLDQKTGDVRWSYKVGKHPDGKGILSSPALHAGVVYFGAYDGSTYAIDTETGKKVWQNDEADWVGSSPSISEKHGLLYIGLEFGLFRKRGGIAAIDLSSGKTVWSDRTTEMTHGSPLFIPEENMVVIGSNDGIVYAYDAKNGRRRWQLAAHSPVKSSFAYDKKRRLIVFGTLDGILLAIFAPDGTHVHACEATAGFYSTPLIIDDIAYLSCLDKCLHAFDLAQGKIVRSTTTSGRIFASPIEIENAIWIGSNDGRLYKIDPKTGKILCMHQFTEKIVNRIVHNPMTKAFFVPTVANELYCMRRNEK